MGMDAAKRQRLFDEHAGLIDEGSRTVWRRTPGLNGLDENDYRQLAAIGLLDACKKYRPSKGDFRRYALQRIKGAIRDGIREADDVTRSLRAAGQAPGPRLRLDHPTVGSDADRALLLRDMIASRTQVDRMAAYDELRAALCCLPLEMRMAVYLSAVGELSDWEIGCLLGRPRGCVALLREGGMEQLRKYHTHRRAGASPAEANLQGTLFSIS
jgi:RNA polymerase sigma factor (sigma-70 family)